MFDNRSEILHQYISLVIHQIYRMIFLWRYVCFSPKNTSSKTFFHHLGRPKDEGEGKTSRTLNA